MTDPTADLLIRIKNAYMAKHVSLSVPSSKVKYAIAQILAHEGYVKSVSIEGEPNRRIIKIDLIYIAGKPKITNIRQISKPGVRIYTKSAQIPRVLGGLGISILSTPKGIMGSQEARSQHLGGELICQVW